MKCLGCDCVLTDFDATIKYASSGKYLDLCTRCRRSLPSNILLVERADLDPGEIDSQETDEHDDSYSED